MTVPNMPYKASQIHAEFETGGTLQEAARKAGLFDAGVRGFKASEFAGKSAEIKGGPIETPPLGTPWPGPGICYFSTNDVRAIFVNGQTLFEVAHRDRTGNEAFAGSFAYNNGDVITVDDGKTLSYYCRRYSNDKLKMGPMERITNNGNNYSPIFPGRKGQLSLYSDDRRTLQVYDRSLGDAVMLRRPTNPTYGRGATIGGMFAGFGDPQSWGDSIRAVLRPWVNPITLGVVRKITAPVISADRQNLAVAFTATEHCMVVFYPTQGTYSYESNSGGQGGDHNGGTVTMTGYRGPDRCVYSINGGPQLPDKWGGGSNHSIGGFFELFKGDTIIASHFWYDNGTPRDVTLFVQPLIV